MFCIECAPFLKTTKSNLFISVLTLCVNTSWKCERFPKGSTFGVVVSGTLLRLGTSPRSDAGRQPGGAPSGTARSAGQAPTVGLGRVVSVCRRNVLVAYSPKKFQHRTVHTAHTQKKLCLFFFLRWHLVLWEAKCFPKLPTHYYSSGTYGARKHAEIFGTESFQGEMERNNATTSPCKPIACPFTF